MSFHDIQMTEAKATIQRADSLNFARFGKCLAASRGDAISAQQMFLAKYPRSTFADAVERKNFSMDRKALIDPMATATSTPLDDFERASAAFSETIRPRALLGRMGLQRFPDHTRVPAQTGESASSWIGEAEPIALSSMAFQTASHSSLKLATLIVTTQDLATAAGLVAERQFADDMALGIISATDRAAFDPTVTAIPDIRPDSLTATAPVVNAAAPTDGEAIESQLADCLDLIETDFVRPFVIMRPKTAIHLTRQMRSGGAPIFPFLTITGGSILGIPVLISSSAYIDTATGLADITIIDAAAFRMIDGVIELGSSRHATLEMNDAPDGTNPKVSLWQNNLVSLRAIRHVNWFSVGNQNAICRFAGFPG